MAPTTGGDRRADDRRYLWAALVLIAGLLVAEVVVAVFSGSLALLSDAGHMLTDAGALAMSLVALQLAVRPATSRWTFGLKRAEILSGAVNGVTLLLIGAVIGVEAIRRLFLPPPVQGLAVLVVALVGILVNLAATWSLAHANRTSLNVEGSFQHILTDLYGFIATAVAGLVIMLTGFERADPIASLVVVFLMLRAARRLLRDSGRILLEAAPEGLDLDQVRRHLGELEHVHEVHDLHAWTVTSDLPALSAHVVVDDTCFRDGHAPQLLDHMQACLAGHFDVEHSTFQLEPAGHGEHEFDTH
ncbi:MAG: cation diffusion facilitator family transporter [Marmoricola sp.]